MRDCVDEMTYNQLIVQAFRDLIPNKIISFNKHFNYSSGMSYDLIKIYEKMRYDYIRFNDTIQSKFIDEKLILAITLDEIKYAFNIQEEESFVNFVVNRLIQEYCEKTGEVIDYDFEILKNFEIPIKK